MRQIRQATLYGNDSNNNWRWENYSLLKLSMDARKKSKKRGAKSLRNLRQKKKKVPLKDNRSQNLGLGMSKTPRELNILGVVPFYSSFIHVYVTFTTTIFNEIDTSCNGWLKIRGKRELNLCLGQV